jgi:transcriptional regulator with XRE-family HTH domain
MHRDTHQLARLVGAEVKLRRRLAGLSACGLAERAGLPAERVSAIEAGRIIADLAELARLAAALECDLATLLAEVG